MVKDRFPVTVDRPFLFLIWEMDEFIVFMVPLILTLPIRSLLFGIIIGVLAMKIYIEIKRNKPENFLFHTAWKNGIVKVKGCPQPYIKKFLE